MPTIYIGANDQIVTNFSEQGARGSERLIGRELENKLQYVLDVQERFEMLFIV